MKKLLLLFVSIVTLSIGFIQFGLIGDDISVDAQEKEIPPYAKWGQIAVKETIKKYPDADLVDYLHRGRTYNDGTATEHFKLWLRGKDREFGVFVDVEFDPSTEKTISVSFKETDK
ncbi:YqzG/YhdC family protein [Ornithinibacillus halophilus]|uniref:DUF3889 domain-containing protein n=1 Tax=Ornithinibacillus halophilus TaxID=930117 RepID=A0A1M5FNZ9_9BACI|nr:YqzG/YhdC family protein [Ornithinibacillus halophilus]SHF93223.1 Protein of unknown function [Ornithinibacillus halophilus]